MCPAVTTTDSTIAVRDDLRFAQISANTAQLTFTIEPSVDCWSFHLTLQPSEYPKLRNGDGFRLRVYRTDDPTISVRAAGDFIVDSDRMYAARSSIKQGYVACRFPNVAAEAGNVAGQWTAQIAMMAGSNFSDIGFVPANVPAWLSTRALALQQPVPTNAQHEHRLPVQFILVSPRETLSEAVFMLRNAIRHLQTNVFGSTFAEVKISAPTGDTIWNKTTADAYTSDLYSPATRLLLQEFAVAGCLNVFILQNFTITGQSAVGFAMIPGPQGFRLEPNAIMVKQKMQDRTETAERLGKRMAHEIGHFLGLIHESSCLDGTATAGDMAVCQLALDVTGSPSNANRAAVQGNLMFKGEPGARLNPKQRFVVRNAPRVAHRVVVPKTPVTKLRIKVHTGLGVRSTGDFFRGDFAGTDDKVFLVIQRSGPHVVNEINSAWDDFAAGSDWWYQLDPTDSLFEEDIVGFKIFKSFDREAHAGLFGDDHWLLQGAIIEINGRVWYSNDSIHTWLANDDEEPSEFSAAITRPTARATHAAALADDPAPSYVTPPFINYPVTLAFDGRTSRVLVPTLAGLGIPAAACAVQVWIRTPVFAGEQVLVSAGDSSAGFALRINDAQYQVVVTVNGTDVLASAPVPTGDYNRWIHLCATYGSGVWAIHRNGDHLAQSPPTAGFPTVAGGNLCIGARADGGGAFFKGQMRNLSVWRVARTAADELRDLFRVDPHDPDVALYLSMADGDGDVCYDETTSENDAAIVNAAWVLPDDAPPSAMFFPAAKGGAAAGYVTIPNSELINEAMTGEGALTVSAWIKSGHKEETEPGERMIFGNDSFALRIVNGSYVCGLVSGTDDSVGIPVPPGDAGQWVHLSGQYDRDARKWRLFRNGFLVGERDARVGFKPPPQTSNWYLGGSPRAATAGWPIEIRTVWLHAAPVPAGALRTLFMPWWGTEALPERPYLRAHRVIACWPLNEGIGNAVFDARWPEGRAADGSFTIGQVGWSVAPRYRNLRFVDAAAGETIGAVLRLIGSGSATNPYLVFLSGGTFNERVTLPRYVSLIGRDPKATTITADAVSGQGPFGTVIMADGCELRQMTVVSTATADAEGVEVVPIQIDGALTVTLDHVTAKTLQDHRPLPSDANLKGVCVNRFGHPGDPAATRVVITNCRFVIGTTPGQAMTAMRATVTMINCVSVNPGYCTLHIANGATATLFGCQIDAGAVWALIADDSAHIVADHCQIAGQTRGNVTIVNA